MMTRTSRRKTSESSYLPEMKGLLSLHDGCVEMIYSKLSLEHLAAVRATCKHLRDSVSNSPYWSWKANCSTALGMDVNLGNHEKQATSECAFPYRGLYGLLSILKNATWEYVLPVPRAPTMRQVCVPFPKKHPQVLSKFLTDGFNPGLPKGWALLHVTDPERFTSAILVGRDKVMLMETQVFSFEWNSFHWLPIWVADLRKWTLERLVPFSSYYQWGTHDFDWWSTRKNFRLAAIREAPNIVPLQSAMQQTLGNDLQNPTMNLVYCATLSPTELAAFPGEETRIVGSYSCPSRMPSADAFPDEISSRFLIGLRST